MEAKNSCPSSSSLADFFFICVFRPVTPSAPPIALETPPTSGPVGSSRGVGTVASEKPHGKDRQGFRQRQRREGLNSRCRRPFSEFTVLNNELPNTRLDYEI